MASVGSFDLLTTVRTYRTLLDPEDRTLAVGPPFLLLDGRRQPEVTHVAYGVAAAMALRELNAGVNSALRFAPREAPWVASETAETAEAAKPAEVLDSGPSQES